MKRNDIIKIIKEVTSKNNIKRTYLFGSFARNERYNDIDIVIEKPKKFSLLDLSRLAIILEEKLGIHVDIITVKSIHPKLRSIIESEMVEI